MEQSLSIRASSDQVVSLKCFRASCGWFGLTMADPDAVRDLKKLKQGRVYREPIVPLSAETIAFLGASYGLQHSPAVAHGIGQSPSGRDLVMTVRDRYGREIGHQTRTLYEQDKRCFTFKATAQPWLDFWLWPAGKHEQSRHIFVVEDTLSAWRLYGLGIDAVALMGTGMSQAQAAEIAAEAGEQGAVTIALDRDAFDKATKLAKRHRLVLPEATRVICLTEDIKDIQGDDEILELIHGEASTGSGLQESESS